MKKLLPLLFSLCFILTIQAQVSKTLEVRAAGSLSTLLTADEKLSITNLTLTGSIDARDFNMMRKLMPALKVINLEEISIAAYSGTEGPLTGNLTVYPANQIPAFAFQNYSNIASMLLPSSATAIGGGAFGECNWLTEIKIPPSVTSIGSSAFYGCTRLTSMIIPPSVDSIADHAFIRCSRITSFFIPSSVTSIHYSSFMESGSLTVDENNPVYSSLDGVLYNKAKTELLHYPTFMQGNFKVPSSVTSIRIAAFIGCEGLNSVSLPPSLTTIEEAAFDYCKGLTSVSIPTSITSIGRKAFYGCSALKSINFPFSLTSIGSYAFWNCIGLTSIVLTTSVKAIDSFAFGGCKGLTSIILPPLVTILQNGTFVGCTSLTSIIIPPSVTTIGSSVFAACDSLTSINIPSSVTTLGSGVFSGCKSLSTISIPSSVTAIGSEVFKDCPNLTFLSVYGIKPIDLCNSCLVFDGIDKTICTLYVPFLSRTAYKNRYPWNTFTNIVEMKGISLSTTAIDIPAGGGTSAVQLKSNTSWLLSSDESWLSWSRPSNGEGDAPLYFTVAANPETILRTARVTISVEGADAQTILFTQAADITGIPTTQNKMMDIYPNPANDVLKVSYPSKTARVSLFDINGRLVLDKTISGKELNVSHLASGFYNVRITCKERVEVFKLQVIR